MKTILAAFLLLAGAAPDAPADPFCDAVRRLDRGAAGTPPFAGLAGTRLDALLGSRCLVPPKAVTLLCTRNLLPREITRQSVIDGIRRCLPAATLEESSRRESVVRHDRLLIGVTERGADRAHVGRIITLYIRAAQ